MAPSPSSSHPMQPAEPLRGRLAQPSRTPPPSTSTPLGIGQRQSQRPRRSHTLVSASSSSTQASPATGSVSYNDAINSGSRWTAKEDLLLISGIKTFGCNWTRIKTVFDQSAGGTSCRTPSSFKARYDVLVRQIARQQGQDQRSISAPSSASSSSSSTTPATQHQALVDLCAALTAASSQLHSRTRGHGFEPWTSRETQFLSAFGPSSSGVCVYKAFCEAFPTNKRTQPAIISKWLRVLRSTGWKGGIPGRGHGTKHAAEEEQEHEGDEEGDALAMHAYEGQEEDDDDEFDTPPLEGAACQSSSMLRPSWPSEAGKAGAYAKGYSWADAAASGRRASYEEESDVSRIAQHFGGEAASYSGPASPHKHVRFSSPTTSSFWQQTPQPIDYCIDIKPGGVVIANLPVGHQIHLHSPTQFQVVVPEATGKQGAETHSPTSAAFAFEIMEGGAVQPLKLPEGTTSSVGLVQAQEEQGDGDGSYAQTTRFVSPCGGFSIVFVTNAG